jgi:hypothetical protein
MGSSLIRPPEGAHSRRLRSRCREACGRYRRGARDSVKPAEPAVIDWGHSPSGRHTITGSKVVSPKLIRLNNKPRDDHVEYPDEAQFPRAVNGAANGRAEHDQHKYSRQQHGTPRKVRSRKVVAANSGVRAVVDQATGPTCLASMPRPTPRPQNSRQNQDLDLAPVRFRSGRVRPGVFPPAIQRKMPTRPCAAPTQHPWEHFGHSRVDGRCVQ